MNYWKWLHQDEGATAVEYAVLLGLIITLCIISINSVGQAAAAKWAYSQTEIEAL